MSKHSIQDLVDEHARIGMDDKSIRDHLMTCHNVEEFFISPPTKNAKKDRNYFYKTGRVREDKLIFSKTIRSSKENINIENKDNSIAPPLSFKDMEERAKQFEKNMQAKGISVTAKLYDIDPDDVDINDFYVHTGKTFLDRVINILHKMLLYEDVSQDRILSNNFNTDASRLTVFELCRLFADEIIENDTEISYDECLDDTIPEQVIIGKIISPWVSSENKTTHNLSIDKELWSLFISGDEPKKINYDDLFTCPVFLDVRNNKCAGDWEISAVIAKPMEDGNIFFSAFCEWRGVGFESLVVWETNKESKERTEPIVFFFWHSEVLDSQSQAHEILKEKICQFYDDIPKKCEQVVVMSLMYEKELTTHEYFPAVSTKRIKDLSPKKQSSKQKTHSLFKVRKINAPFNKFGMSEDNINRSWSLDHIVFVEGHFRWQPYGENKSKRKLIWIEPYRKGKDWQHHSENRPEIRKLNIS